MKRNVPEELRSMESSLKYLKYQKHYFNENDCLIYSASASVSLNTSSCVILFYFFSGFHANISW